MEGKISNGGKDHKFVRSEEWGVESGEGGRKRGKRVGRYTRKARPDLVAFLRTRRSIKFRSYGPSPGRTLVAPHHTLQEEESEARRDNDSMPLHLFSQFSF